MAHKNSHFHNLLLHLWESECTSTEVGYLTVKIQKNSFSLNKEGQQCWTQSYDPGDLTGSIGVDGIG